MARSVLGPRHRPAALTAAGMALVLGLGGAAVALGEPTPPVRPDLHAGVVWLVSDSRSVVTAVDVATARPVAEVALPATTTPVRVSSQPTGVTVLDPATATLTAVDAARFTSPNPLSLSTKGFQPSTVFASDTGTVVADERAGRFATLTDGTLSPITRLSGAVTASGVAADGVVWLVSGELGTVVGVTGRGRSRPLRVCSGAAGTCFATVVDGTVVTLDATNGEVRELAYARHDTAPQQRVVADLPEAAGPVVVGSGSGALASYHSGQLAIARLDGASPRIVPVGLVRPVTSLALVGDRAVLADDAGGAIIVDTRTGDAVELPWQADRGELSVLAVDGAVVVNDRGGDQAAIVTEQAITPFAKFDPVIAERAVRPGEAGTSPASTAEATPAPEQPGPDSPATAQPSVPPPPSPARGLALDPLGTSVPATPDSPATPAGRTVPPPSAESSTPRVPGPSAPAPRTPAPTPPSGPSAPPVPPPTTPEAPRPAAPDAPRVSLAADASATTALASWQPGSGGAIDRWQAQLLDESQAVVATTDTAADARSWQSDVRCGRYAVRVTAIGPGGSATAISDPVLICPPLGAISALTATARTGTVVGVSWQAPVGDQVAHRISVIGPSRRTVDVSAGGLTAVDVAALTPDTDYVVRVEATDRYGRSVRAETSVQTLPGTTRLCAVLAPREGKLSVGNYSFRPCDSANPDLRLYAGANRAAGIDTVVRLYSTPSGQTLQERRYRLGATTLDGVPLSTLGSLDGQWTDEGVLGYAARAPIPGADTSSVVGYSYTGVSGVIGCQYTDGRAPQPWDATIAELGRVVGAT